MSKISFDVTARTARLIGQENFASADGAIIELVKNCYDADAKNAIIVFDLKYPKVPQLISQKEYNQFNSENGIISEFYIPQGDAYKFHDNSDLIENSIIELNNFFNSKNALYIIDNGEGMDRSIISEKWMKIGTDNKLLQFTSDKGRIKTGAKGLGRFALDRLGKFSTILTKNIKSSSGFEWKMDWSQFEDQSKLLSEVQADLTNMSDLNLLDVLKTDLKNESLNEVLENKDFQSGTIIKINSPRDIWDNIEIKKLHKSLESLIPPIELGVFSINLIHLQNSKEYGNVSTAFFNDFDYKIDSFYDSKNLDVTIKITREELDLKIYDENFSNILDNESAPYNLKTLERKTFEYKKSINKILKWRLEDSQKQLADVGSFRFSFYFTKLSKPNKDDKLSYPYQEKDYESIKKSFENFGGVKIYRDHFRVRPYGEPGDDWLDLGKRQASSPASAGQRIGDWRVRSRQIAGIINISRVTNPELRDKSDRSSLIENTSFETFKEIIIGIINEFEYDRSRILNPFFLERKRKLEIIKEEELQRKALEIANQIVQARDNNSNETKADSETKDLILEKLKEFSQEEDERVNNEENEKDIELRLSRSLASLGLIVASFDHELKSISNNLIPRLEFLQNHLKSLISNDIIIGLPDYKNPFTLIKHISEDHHNLKGWLDYSLNAIKMDKRKRKTLNYGSYFEKWKENWSFVLKERNVNVILKGDKNINNSIKAFEIDMDSIFNNLLTNSLEAFKLRREKYNREIIIDWINVSEQIEIIYSDNGIGLSDVFSHPEEIFQPMVTTKKDRKGNNIGTGLGMYIVKNVIDDYKGTVEIMNSEQGFKIKISFKK
ncbi:sensor histidine kinase [Flavobacterium sp. DG2-3]|uniref:sensor histidine kinase n=1 Tax=Flavobacterium sp. DG2-3 TaxID=3068317 RepID=UPI00273F6BAB|nr:sensor histidine kinase [Flavobacterium sp. DG2-3]MDP5202356.1 sensor histidine kinase [Flavobacterium sp. DG2-3]